MSTFPGPELVAKEFTVCSVTRLPGFLTGGVEHASIVASENDKRIVCQLSFIEGSEDLTDNPVEFVDEVAVEPAIARTDELRCGSEWVMDIGCREIEEEGRFPVALLNPFHCAFGECRSNLIVDV